MRKAVLAGGREGDPLQETSLLVVHVFHSDPAPDPHHEGLNLTLIGAACYAEVAVLPPFLAPGVGSRLMPGGMGTERRREEEKNSLLQNSRWDLCRIPECPL